MHQPNPNSPIVFKSYSNSNLDYSHEPNMLENMAIPSPILLHFDSIHEPNAP